MKRCGGCWMTRLRRSVLAAQLIKPFRSIAMQRLLQLSQALLVGRDAHKLFADGPCSPAHPLREDWHRR